MDTPEKSTQITTPLSKFEDSPVFNYINSLSPIKPVKSIPIAQTFHSLSFATLPSVFTSPHLSSHKESRFLRRHNYSDPLKHGISSETECKVCGDEEAAGNAAQLYENSDELQENFDAVVSIGESSAEPSSEHLKFAIELPQTLKYDCGSPDCDSTPHCGTQMDCVSALTSTSASLMPFAKEASKKSSHEDEMHLQAMLQIEQKKEAAECDWESLISDAADLLIFNSPIDPEAFKGIVQKSLDPSAGFYTSINEVHKINCVEQHEMEDPSTQPRETIDLKHINQIQDNLAPDNKPNECMTSNSSEKTDNEVGTSVSAACEAVTNYRGMRRRCLDFETVGARRRNLDDSSCSSSSLLVHSDAEIACKDKQLVPVKPGSDSSRCILPGIGLHLNALAITTKDKKNIKDETLSSTITLPGSAASLPSPTTDQELDESLTLESTERDMDPTGNGVPLAEDVCKASAYLANEDFNPISPKKKRRKLEGESEGCKRCNCKKSKCLKLYCECFAAGVYCIEPCSCQDCFNKPIHEDTVLATRKQIESRNPLAFAPKVIRTSESVPEIGDESSKTPASARHKRGCNCKKSSCLKKYCECYQGGVGCSINCRCEGCKNAFGRKDGSSIMETEAEAEDETEASEKSAVDKLSQKTEVHNNEEQNPNSALSTTPLQIYRSLVQLPFSSKGKLPRSFLGIGSSSGLYNGLKYGKPSILRSQPQFQKQLQTLPDDDIPEILQGSSSPCSSIKTSSPNSKRISPPHSNLGSSPSRRSGRKLILQSIPSFPSLTPQH